MADMRSELWVLKIVYFLNQGRSLSPVSSSPPQESPTSTHKEVPADPTGSP